MSYLYDLGQTLQDKGSSNLYKPQSSPGLPPVELEEVEITAKRPPNWKIKMNKLKNWFSKLDTKKILLYTGVILLIGGLAYIAWNAWKGKKSGSATSKKR